MSAASSFRRMLVSLAAAFFATVALVAQQVAGTDEGRPEPVARVRLEVRSAGGALGDECLVEFGQRLELVARASVPEGFAIVEPDTDPRTAFELVLPEGFSVVSTEVEAVEAGGEDPAGPGQRMALHAFVAAGIHELGPARLRLRPLAGGREVVASSRTVTVAVVSALAGEEVAASIAEEGIEPLPEPLRAVRGSAPSLVVVQPWRIPMVVGGLLLLLLGPGLWWRRLRAQRAMAAAPFVRARTALAELARQLDAGGEDVATVSACVDRALRECVAGVCRERTLASKPAAVCAHRIADVVSEHGVGERDGGGRGEAGQRVGSRLGTEDRAGSRADASPFRQPAVTSGPRASLERPADSMTLATHLERLLGRCDRGRFAATTAHPWGEAEQLVVDARSFLDALEAAVLPALAAAAEARRRPHVGDDGSARESAGAFFDGDSAQADTSAPDASGIRAGERARDSSRPGSGAT
jgi:hypothetical protein